MDTIAAGGPGEDLRGALEAGLTLPAGWYTDPAVHRLELARVFGRTWQYAGIAADVAEPGRFTTCVAGATPIVVARDRSGTLRAHVNVCRHRTHLLATGSGRVDSLTCQHDGWTYELDGSLRAAPRDEADAPALLPASVATWGPLLLVNPTPDAPPPGAVLDPLGRALAEAGVDVDGLVYHGRSRAWSVRANWKLVIENYLECYHCPVAHPGFSRLIDVDPDAYRLETSRWTSSQFGPVEESPRARHPYRATGAVRAAQFHYVWPNWTLNVFPGPPNLRVLVLVPDGPDRTSTFVDGFWAPGTPETTIAEITEFGAVVGAEDTALVESVHEGLATGLVPHGRLLLDSERLIQHFQLLVQDALAQAGGRAPAAAG